MCDQVSSFFQVFILVQKEIYKKLLEHNRYLKNKRYNKTIPSQGSNTLNKGFTLIYMHVFYIEPQNRSQLIVSVYLSVYLRIYF